VPLDNPYIAPTSDLIVQPRSAVSPDSWRCHWLLGYALNLIVPGLFASGTLSPAGVTGLVAAVLLMAAMGSAILTWRPSWTRPAAKGAILVALTQFFPVLQMISGMVAVSLACEITGAESLFDDDHFGRKLELVGGFLATVLTALPLLAVSIVVGAIAQWVFAGSARLQTAKPPITSDSGL